jgi:hypothetical protein
MPGARVLGVTRRVHHAKDAKIAKRAGRNESSKPAVLVVAVL